RIPPPTSTTTDFKGLPSCRIAPQATPRGSPGLRAWTPTADLPPPPLAPQACPRAVAALALALAPAPAPPPGPPAVAAAPISQVRQNYHPDCEAAVDSRISLELSASYVYQSMAFSFDRDDGALRNLARFFQRQAREETQHAEMLVELQNRRGGRIRLRDVKKPDRDAWESGPRATERALHLEKRVNQSLPARPDLHRLATDQNDAQLCDFLEARSLRERASERARQGHPRALGGYGTSLRSVGAPEAGLAEYPFDRLTLRHSHKEN
ncbi:ferritin heavy chain-like isoform X5, partial [Canis lupus familiaris]